MEMEWLARAGLCVAMVGAGALVIWMARAAASGRLKRNHLAGIRISSTMASDAAWLAGHVRAEKPTIYGGIASIVSGVVALIPVPMPVVVTAVLVACAALLVLTLYAAHVGGKAATAVSTGREG